MRCDVGRWQRGGTERCWREAGRGDGLPLWWLALAAGSLPALAALVAFWLAVAQGQFPACNPLLDGCVSISRAGRYDLPNILFRALLLPGATLQGLVWLLGAEWLRRLGAARDRLVGLLPWLGMTAAVALVLYGTFLGSDGDGYRWMRRYGVVVYFGFTCIAMLIVARSLFGLTANDTRLHLEKKLLQALVILLPVLGLINATAPLYLVEAPSLDALENITEWWGGLVFTCFFTLLSWLWWRTSFSMLSRAGSA